MKMRRFVFGYSTNAQRRLVIRATKLDTERPLRDNGDAKRFKCLEEERFARCIVADAKYDVVKHVFS
jgi:hypothetical protein